MVFPILFLLILLLLFMGMFAYQNVVVTYAAAITSERAAFSWDNSHRDPRSGILNEAAYDGLYTGMGSDGAIASLFGMAGEEESASVVLPAEREAGERGALAETKLAKASGILSAAGISYEGKASRSNEGLLRLVRMKLDKPIGAEIVRPWGGGGFADPAAGTAALITDPVSFIRNVDLARYYTRKFSDAAGSRPKAKRQAGDVLSKYGGADQP